MRILHDPVRCASTGMCEVVAPNIFEVGADGVLRVLEGEPREDLRELVLVAVAGCPTQALRLG